MNGVTSHGQWASAWRYTPSTLSTSADLAQTLPDVGPQKSFKNNIHLQKPLLSRVCLAHGTYVRDSTRKAARLHQPVDFSAASDLLKQLQWLVGIGLGLKLRDWNANDSFSTLSCFVEVARLTCCVCRNRKFANATRALCLIETHGELRLVCDRETTVFIKAGPVIRVGSARDELHVLKGKGLTLRYTTSRAGLYHSHTFDMRGARDWRGPTHPSVFYIYFYSLKPSFLSSILQVYSHQRCLACCLEY